MGRCSEDQPQGVEILRWQDDNHPEGYRDDWTHEAHTRAACMCFGACLYQHSFLA